MVRSIGRYILQAGTKILDSKEDTPQHTMWMKTQKVLQSQECAIRLVRGWQSKKTLEEGIPQFGAKWDEFCTFCSAEPSVQFSCNMLVTCMFEFLAAKACPTFSSCLALPQLRESWAFQETEDPVSVAKELEDVQHRFA